MKDPELTPEFIRLSDVPDESPSIASENMRNDPKYAPYCMRCPGLKRMRRVAPLLAKCDCGAQHEMSPRKENDAND